MIFIILYYAIYYSFILRPTIYLISYYSLHSCRPKLLIILLITLQCFIFAPYVYCTDAIFYAMLFTIQILTKYNLL